MALAAIGLEMEAATLRPRGRDTAEMRDMTDTQSERDERLDE